MEPLFQQYLAADYSGAGQDHEPQKAIVVYRAEGRKRPVRRPRPGQKPFSRQSLTQYLIDRFEQADKAGQRIIFGLDHQFAWPAILRELSGLDHLPWRDFIKQLAQGQKKLPPLDTPKRYCREFNHFAGRPAFWTPMIKRAASYHLPRKPLDAPHEKRHRLTELKLFQAGYNPKPADAVGGQGKGVVGGQTICGLKQIPRLLDLPSVKWWPYDGLDLHDDSYKNKHVGVEIYPAVFLPADVPKSDDNDAKYTCQALQTADRLGWLRNWGDLSGLGLADRETVLKEGWVLGVHP